MGEDGHGNKYYEIKRGVQYGRHRYVIYKDVHLDEYTPTLVPPEWHGWLHYMHDKTGPELVRAPPQFSHPSRSRALSHAPAPPS